MFITDRIDDVGELLHRGDDDLLAGGDHVAKVRGLLCMTNQRTHLSKLLDGVADLLVEDLAVGHHDHRVEHGRGDAVCLTFDTHELMCQPRDRV